MLEAPITTKESHFCESTEGIQVGASGMQGWRLEMEDAHIVQDMPGKMDHMFLAIFDGHAGAGAAKFAASNFIEIIESTDEWKSYLAGNCESVEALSEALIKTFLKVDEDMRAHQIGTQGSDSSGCTSVTAMVTPRFIVCANAGDSRCVIGTNGTAKPLSDDHKPYGEIEKLRIEKAGGFVQWNRVDGDLAVSRALGDFSYKNRSDFEAKDQKITCYPDISIHERDGSDDVLILACDGLWDVMTSEEAIETVRKLYSLGESSMVKIAEELIDQALEKGSKDNISAVVAKLPGAKLGPESLGGVDAIRQSRLAARSEQQVGEREEGGCPFRVDN